MFRLNEVEIVRRGMILSEGCELAALKKSDRQIEAGRAILPFIIAVRKEIQEIGIFSRRAQHVGHGTVNKSVTSAASLVGGAPCIAHAGDHQAVLYLAESGLVRGEPSYRSYRTRHEEEAIAQARALCDELTR